MSDQVEEQELIKQEKLSQMKILESLDFNSFNSNREDIEEQFGGQLKKKFKNDSGDAKNIHQNEKKIFPKSIKPSFNKKSVKEINGDDKTQGEGQTEKKEQQPRNVKPKAPKDISANWQKFMIQQNKTIEPSDKATKNTQNGEKQSQNTHTSIYKSLEPSKDGFKGSTPIVAIDCEMVQCYGSSNNSLPTQELARVSIVNYNGHVLIDTYVRPQKKIKDYLTRVSGITFTHIKNAPTYNEVKNKIFEILKDKIIVGHSIQHDLTSIKFTPSKDNLLRDISNYKDLRRAGKKVSLKKMVQQELGITFQEGSHDSVSDARAALLIYKKYQKQIDQEQGKK